jgi:hypothetical protein
MPLFCKIIQEKASEFVIIRGVTKNLKKACKRCKQGKSDTTVTTNACFQLPPNDPRQKAVNVVTCAALLPLSVSGPTYTARVGTSFEFFGVFFLNFLWPVAKKLATR